MSRNSSIIIYITLLFALSVVNCFATAQKAVCVSGGEEHSMILAEDGRVFTAGLYDDGQLGRPGDNSIFSLVLKGEMTTDSNFLENISGISAGWQHSLVLTEDNHVLAFGDNFYGQLENGKSLHCAGNSGIILSDFGKEM
jgi:alpha-tubulin suppressor-like RCC1 family protein